MTSLVHMKNKRVYDPLIGQFLSPDWNSILDKLETPGKIHIYRINGNDPINLMDAGPAFGKNCLIKGFVLHN